MANRAFQETKPAASQCHVESIRLCVVDTIQGAQDSFQRGNTTASMKDELVVQAAKKADLVQPVKVAGFVKANQGQVQVSERKRLGGGQACPGSPERLQKCPSLQVRRNGESSLTAVASSYG
ncbi:hypothetical protein AYL99_04956 [Fonsecaea erecta]|uniref:Uncharacterized protein n=1 Tax=Fonsecaea erecta TaxID=1367422 RepID=A0A178ZJI4_9EURO|nr:hypothetical protein AYL99_04956 [Fonsecaea erecta]OAP59954.1 hypothetical protein AYL99_04956 [Fonsecaea erecta]